MTAKAVHRHGDYVYGYCPVCKRRLKVTRHFIPYKHHRPEEPDSE